MVVGLLLRSTAIEIIKSRAGINKGILKGGDFLLLFIKLRKIKNHISNNVAARIGVLCAKLPRFNSVKEKNNANSFINSV